MRHGPRCNPSLLLSSTLALLATACGDDLSLADVDTTGATTPATDDGEPALLASPAAAFDPVALDMCCEPGCTGTLLQSAQGKLQVAHDGSRIVTRDVGAVLWDADTLAPISRFASDTMPVLRGGKLFYRLGAGLHVVDASDGSELAVCPNDVKWGVASDGSYLWTANDAGMFVRELDCSIRWKFGGPLADGRIHALADAVHVWDAGIHPFAVFHLDAADGASTMTPFEGDYPRFFADSARYWTQNKTVHRVFTAEGVELFSGEGYPLHGWGTRLMIGLDVVDISAPGVKLAGLSQYGFVAGPVIGSAPSNGKLEVIHLDTDPVKSEWITPQDCCGYQGAWSFASAGDKWVYAGENGRSVDHLGRQVTVGAIAGLAGAPTGRVVAGTAISRAYTFDVADDCTATAHPWFPRNPGRLTMSGDGELLVSQEHFLGWPLQNPPFDGTRFYALPQGELLASSGMGLHSSLVLDHDVADDGTVWSRTWATVALPVNAHSGSFPFGEGYTGAVSDVLPKISPSGDFIVTSDGTSGHLDDWVGDDSRIYVSNEEKKGFPMTIFPGIAHGFLDDAHILVGHYVDPDDKFAGSEIVDLNGFVVQPTTLPDIHRFYRIGTGEILARRVVDKEANAFGPWAIYDPWTGDVLWTAPAGTTVAPVGHDFVAIAVDGRLDLHRWR